MKGSKLQIIIDECNFIFIYYFLDRSKLFTALHYINLRYDENDMIIYVYHNVRNNKSIHESGKGFLRDT